MIFNKSGHLDAAAVEALKKGRLPPEALAEAAEHTAVCTVCAAALADSFGENELAAVPAGFSEAVLSKADFRKENSRQFVFYSLRVALAASIALFILFSGAFSGLSLYASERGSPPDLDFPYKISESIRDSSKKLLDWEVFYHDQEKE